MSKYDPLFENLSTRRSRFVPMTFREIEKILGFELPPSKIYPAWWSNNPSNNVMTKCWLRAGYKTESVDTTSGKLVFHRDETLKNDKDTLDQSGKNLPGNPLFGSMTGTMTIYSGTDITEPAAPDWGNDN